jgi:hypothetical protein
MFSNAHAETITPELARELVERVSKDVAEIRELPFKKEVPVQVVDDAGAREHFLARLDAMVPEEQMIAVETAYKLLGMIPEEMTLLDSFLAALEEQAGGFYDPPSGEYFLLSDMPAAMAPTLTAHELTHALEDQHFDLDRRMRARLSDEDRSFALGAVHEGSATLLMSVFTARQMFSGEMDAEELQAAAQAEADKMKVLTEMPQVLLRQLVGPYVLGAAFFVDGNMMSLISTGYPTAKVNKSFADTPVSSEQILHPEKYWDPAHRDEPRTIDLGRAGAKLGKGWKQAGAGVLGELSLGVMVGAEAPVDPMAMMTGTGNWTNDAAAGWDGDRWQVWRNGDRRVLMLATVWDSPEDAKEFADALDPEAGFVWRIEGDRLALLAGDHAEIKRVDRVLQRLLK